MHSAIYNKSIQSSFNRKIYLYFTPISKRLSLKKVLEPSSIRASMYPMLNYAVPPARSPLDSYTVITNLSKRASMYQMLRYAG
jgi:hypothetical protein